MNKKLMAGVLTAIMALTGCAGATTATTAAGTAGAAGTTTATATTAGATDGKIVVGLEANYAPFNWAQPDDSNGAIKIDGASSYAGGYDVEIAKLIAKGLNKELVIKQVSWDGLIPAMENGAIDLIIAGMSETPERAKNVDFSDVYYDSSYVILTKKGSQWDGKNKISDFAGARVIVQKGTNYEVIAPQLTGAEILPPLTTIPLIIHAIKNEAADLTVVEKPAGISILVSNDDIAMTDLDPNNSFVLEEGVTTAVSIALKKGETEMKAKINEILKTISIKDREKLMEDVIKIQPDGV